MSDQDETLLHLKTLFLECFHIEVPALDTDLFESGILDSLQLVELLLQLEQRFGIRIQIEDIDLDDLRSLAQISRLMVPNETSSAPTRRPTIVSG